MTQPNNITLKACPFCGNPPKTLEYFKPHEGHTINGFTQIRLTCTSCTITFECPIDLKELLFEKWNTRHENN